MSTLCCALLFQQCFKRIVLLFLAKGCLSTRGERILFLDADGATRIADIEKLEKAMDGLTKNDAVGHSFPCLLISVILTIVLVITGHCCWVKGSPAGWGCCTGDALNPGSLKIKCGRLCNQEKNCVLFNFARLCELCFKMKLKTSNPSSVLSSVTSSCMDSTYWYMCCVCGESKTLSVGSRWPLALPPHWSSKTSILNDGSHVCSILFVKNEQHLS